MKIIKYFFCHSGDLCHSVLIFIGVEFFWENDRNTQDSWKLKIVLTLNSQRFKFSTPYIPFSEFLRYLRANITLCKVLLKITVIFKRRAFSPYGLQPSNGYTRLHNKHYLWQCKKYAQIGVKGCPKSCFRD